VSTSAIKRNGGPKDETVHLGARNGIYIIDLQKTLKMFKEAYNFVKEVASRNEYVLFVAPRSRPRRASWKRPRSAGPSM